MSSLLRSLFSGLLLASLTTLTAHAQIVFSSSTSAQYDYAGLSNDPFQSIAQAFQASASGQVTSVSVELRSVQSSGILTMNLYAVANPTDTSWGSILATSTVASPVAGWNAFSFSGVPVAANSYYVIELLPGSGLQTGWASAPGSGSFWSQDGVNYNVDSFNTSAHLVEGSASAIPEPSTYAALFGATALAGAIVLKKRRARHPSGCAL